MEQGEAGTMKPRILFQGLEFKLPKKLTSPRTSFPEAGLELTPLWAKQNQWSFPDLIEIAQNQQYIVPGQNVYPPHFLLIGGSVNCHTDPDYGVTIACLAHDEGSFYANTELVTTHGALTLCRGDVFVFDSYEWHGWISHGPSILAAITVDYPKFE